MKKYLIVLLGFLMLACSKSGVDQNLGQKLPLSFVPMDLMADSDESKSTLDGASVSWTAGDQITVFFDGTPSTFTALTSGTSVRFTGSGNPSASAIYAIYPADPSATISGSSITSNLITTSQRVVADNISDGVNVAVGAYSDNVLRFKNVGALLSFSISANAGSVDALTLIANGGESIAAAGLTTIDYNSGNPSVTSVAGSNTISLTKAAAFNNSETYYCWVLPQTLSKGITLRFSNSSGHVLSLKSTTRSNTIARNARMRLGAVSAAIPSGIFVGWNMYTAIAKGEIASDNAKLYKIKYNYSWSYGLDNDDYSMYPCTSLAPSTNHKVSPNLGSNPNAYVTATVATPTGYTFNPNIQARGPVKGDAFVAVIPVKNLNKGTYISVESAFSAASAAAGAYLMQYSADNVNWYTAEGAYNYTCAAETGLVHYLAVSGTTRKTYDKATDPSYKKYTFPLSEINDIANGNLYIRMLVSINKRAGSDASIDTNAWTDMKGLEIELADALHIAENETFNRENYKW